MSELKLYVIRKMGGDTKDINVICAEGERIRLLMSNPDTVGVLIVNENYMFTVNQVRRLERLTGAVFGEKLSVIY